VSLPSRQEPSGHARRGEAYFDPDAVRPGDEHLADAAAGKVALDKGEGVGAQTANKLAIVVAGKGDMVERPRTRIAARRLDRGGIAQVDHRDIAGIKPVAGK